MNSARPHLLLLPLAVLLVDMAALAQVTGEEKWPDARLLFVVSLAFSQAPLVAVWTVMRRELTAVARWAISAGVVLLWSWQLRQKAPQLAPELADWLLVLGGATLAAALLASWMFRPKVASAEQSQRWQFSLGTLIGLLTLTAVAATLWRTTTITESTGLRAVVLVGAAALLAGLAIRLACPVRRFVRTSIPLAAAALLAGQAMVWTESFAAAQWRFAMGLVAVQSAALVVAGRSLATVQEATKLELVDSDANEFEPPQGAA
jgi:hypothetical protein